MAIALNKKKNFSKTAPEAVLKAQDETVQITRDEWEGMQESLSQLQNFMNDLVEGNLEIEIIDESEEKAEEAEEAEEMAEEGKEEEADMQEVEVPEEMEEVEAEAEEEEKAKDGMHHSEEEKAKDAEEAKDAKHSEEEKAKDAELEAVLQDPAKRKAVFEFLKATDSRSPFQGITMNAVKKRIGRALAKTDSSLPSRKRALDSIMKQILAERDNGSVIESVIVNKAVDTTLTKLADGYHKEAKDGYGQMYDGEGEMSIEQFVQSRVKPGMKDSELDGIVEMICEKYPECKISKAIAMVREAQEGMKSRDAKKAKKVIKRKTLSKAADSLVPDFTSRFLEETRKPKAQDKAKNSKDLSREFSGRFE